MKANVVTPLSKRMANYSQSWWLESIWKIYGRVVRVKIRRNSYDEQSYQEADLFDGNQWNTLVYWPIGPTFKDVSYAGAMRPAWQEIFDKAESALLVEVAMILREHKP
jgi:hypothetical protein